MLALSLMIAVSAVLLVWCHFAAGGGGPRTESHPFTVQDLLAMERITDPQASPDGTWILFDRKVIDLEKNKGVSDLWLVRPDGSDLRRLTAHEAGSTNGRWSPDGKTIFFLSNRSGLMQVWRIAVDGGEAERVTDEPLDVANLVLSRDGKNLAYSMEVYADLSPADTKKRLDEKKEAKSSGRVYEQLFIRHWDTWKDGRRSHLFVRPAAGGDSVDVMPGMDADVPSKPFGGTEEFTFTPDGRSLVFTMADTGREAAWRTRHNLYLAPVDGSAPPRCLTEITGAPGAPAFTPGGAPGAPAFTPGGAWLTHPVFSPDGRRLAYLAMARPGYESDRFRIVVMPWPGGTPTVITENWDRSASGLTWSADGAWLYTTADSLGQHSLFAVAADSGEVRTLARDGKITSPIVAGDRIVFGLCHHRSPVELHSVAPDGSGLRQITRINDNTLASVRMGESEQFTFDGFKGDPVYAYVVKPADFDPGNSYPVAFLIHGGPQGSFGNDFHYRWNPQVYAGAGYGVVMVDFHGSTGYGQAFTDAINDDWGGAPFVDLQKGLAAALERYPWMDGKRVAALGASFGGYMINWIAGHWPDRFHCLVCHDGNLCERLAYYDTEELWFPEWERGGPPWERPEAYEKHNPIIHVANWKTPMLVIHGANDFRVVDTQGISTFTALQRRGIPSKLLYFPDENHWVLKPHNSIQWHDTVIGWLDRWTKDQ